MPKTFYTDRDIEDLAKKGVQSLVVDEDVVLTDLARDKAMRLGIELQREHDKPPAAPERPYIAKLASPSAASSTLKSGAAQVGSSNIPKAPGSSSTEDLHQRVYDAVIAKLGDSLDSNLLNTIIKRVLQNISSP